MQNNLHHSLSALHIFSFCRIFPKTRGNRKRGEHVTLQEMGEANEGGFGVSNGGASYDDQAESLA